MIKAVLLDISGVLYEDDKAIEGAVETVNQLQKHTNLPLRFLTNSSRVTQDMILKYLREMGFHIDESQVFTPVAAVKHLLAARELRPFCLIHPNLVPEFSDIDTANPNAVVLADAADRFDYARLNKAFELLVAGSPLIGIGRNKYFKLNGKLMLDAGPFIVALEYAAGIQAEIMGKPSEAFFLAAVDTVGCEPQDVLMVGDDVEADVNGALQSGLQACLVKTGKYQRGDEDKIIESKGYVAASIVEALSSLLENDK